MLNKNGILRTLVLVPLILLNFVIEAAAQDGADTAGRLKPVFPSESSALIYIEGEDAVSTNFANQAVSNYGCSGFRSLQLSRNIGLQAGAAFYAEFVFYAEEAGDYEFWYGGTPPGPEDDLSPSYGSPFSYRLDENPLKAVYREDVKVIEGYTPAYYWNKVSVENLSSGPHRLRVEVAEKRGYDGRYYFYLDSLFFINKEKEAGTFESRPAVFPKSLESSEIDNPFLTITDYQNYIKNNPDDISALIELSLVYSLLGDFQSSLKVLGKAMALDASDPYPIVLAAKNRLWKGDVNESLALYERALTVYPDDNVLWSEAGKVAAWTANYAKSIDFFVRGIARFPDDLNILVNLGLTYLWMAKNTEAEETFSTARRLASEDPARLRELGSIEEANGYPEYARDVYKFSIEQYPDYLEFYLLLQQSFLASGEREEADTVGRLIEKSFVPSERLNNELEIYREKLTLRDNVIAAYQSKLHDNPGDLELRQELAQTFFWNGMKTEAIEQIKYVLTTHTYRAAETFVRRNSDLLAVSDMAAALSEFFRSYAGASTALRRKLSVAASEVKGAAAAAEGAEDPGAAEKLRQKKQEFADAVSEAVYLAELWDERIISLEGLDEKMKSLLETEKADDEAFSGVIRSSRWSWERNFLINELSAVKESEPELASFMLGLARLAGKEYGRAADVLTPVPVKAEGMVIIETAEDAEASDVSGEKKVEIADYSGLPIGVLYPLYQALLLDMDERREQLIQAESERLYSDFPHLEAVEHDIRLSLELGAVGERYSPPDGVFYEGLLEESTEALSIFADNEKEVRGLQQKIERLLNQQSAVFAKKLERANYYLEADTYLIRFELGNYYLDEGLNKEASAQFRRVIAVDPWNLSATYKLGIVEQRYGNWSEAMKYYKKVYQQDPTYENAVYYYNQLERQNADEVKSSFLMTSTPAEISYLARLDYSTSFDSVFGLNLSYVFDQQRLYREYSGEQKGYFQVHQLEAGIPISFGIIGIEITPRAGIYAESLYYKTDYVFDEPVSLAEFISTFSVYPKFGASASWAWEVLTLDGSWDYSIEMDTFYPDRDIVWRNDFSLNANTWIDLEADFLGPLTTRTYGRLQLMSDDNIKGQVYQDASLGFTLLDAPIIKLYPGLSFNYENSLVSPGTGYYAPRNVIEAKASLRSVFTFPSEDWSSAFEGVLWAAGGGYWSNIGDAAYGEYVKAEGGVGLTWVKNSNAYYLNLYGLGTFNDAGNAYWEVTLALGTGLKLPGLLTP
ncbi:MAG: tetratricopeptide repeat protein [Spirochaetales bacterium]|nr:tetratricopeptide repeat protein [Spirochaetales bacterium]